MVSGMKKILLFMMVLVLVVFGWWWLRGDAAKEGNPAHNGKTPNQVQAFDKKQHSLDDPASPWVVVNKKRRLAPVDYAPADLAAPRVPLRLSAGAEEMQLRREAATALEEMFAAAKKDGLELMVSSAFRSYNFQKGLYNRYVSQQGQAVADTQSARPGHSEHQTGWAVDVEPASRKCEVEECFADTPEGMWVAQHAHEFGFIVRYGKDQQAVTGYIYEPWHLRYVGKPLAEELFKKGNPTLEEFFSLAAAPDYR